jgi:hypothetical protein
MYAERELKRLSEVKSVVRRRIARRRIETIEQTIVVTQPLQWVDRAYSYWKKIGPLAKLALAPLSAWLAGSLFGKRKKVGSLMRWVPTIWSVVRGFQSARASHETA